MNEQKLRLKKKLQTLHHQKKTWSLLSNEEKIMHLDSCMKNLFTIKERWIELCIHAKKIKPHSNTVGQEWLSGPAVLMRALRILKFSLSYNARPPVQIRTHSSSQKSASVIPINLYDRVVFSGISAEILIQKNKPASQGEKFHSEELNSGSVCIVLGAGNVASMPALDLLHKLFSERKVCLLKFNPINEYLEEVFQHIFSSLIDEGFLSLTKGSKEIGEFLCSHEYSDEIHVTGSYETYQAISKYPKKITAELGCVSPMIVVPGDWSEKEIHFQAKQIVSAVENNASFNCNAAKVLIVSKHWKHKNALLNSIRKEFLNTPLRYAYYPGAKERHESFLKIYPQSELFGKKEDSIPWTLIPNVAVNSNEHALNFEAFCGVLAVVELDTNTTESFLSESVNTCNNYIWGNLSCSILVDPHTSRTYKKEIESALSDLKYGSIGVNCWAALSYALFTTTWGAFPEEQVKSGIGVINNGYFFDYPEKSIIRAPFKPLLKPVWFCDHKNAVNIGKNLVEFEYHYNIKSLTKLAFSALKS